MATVEIRLKRPTKVYHEGDTVCGLIEVESKTAIAHQSISLVADGIAALTLSAKSVGRLESMYNNMKPVPLFNYSTELARQGKLAAGKTTVPFEFVLKPRGSIKSLLETYHGVFISVQYNIKCLIKRPLLNKDLSKEVEFLIEYKSGEKASHKPLNFTISPKNENSVRYAGCVLILQDNRLDCYGMQF